MSSVSVRGILGPHVYEDVPFHTHEFSEISGELIISEAQITTLSATKITAGTIGAEVIKLSDSASSRIESFDGTSLIIRGDGSALFTDVTLTGILTVTDGSGIVAIDDGDWAADQASIALNRGFVNPGLVLVDGSTNQLLFRAPFDTSGSGAGLISLYGDATEAGTNAGNIFVTAGSAGDIIVAAGGNTVTFDGAANQWDFFGHWQVEGSDGDITGSLIPSADITHHLGSASQSWQDGYIADVFASFGTAGAPSHSFDGDVDTGGFRPAANEYGIATGGAERLHIANASTEFLNFANFGAASGLTELTIASGSVTATKSFHSIDTENNDPSDSLFNINGGTTGDILVVRSAVNERDVILKHGSGSQNLRMKGSVDRTLLLGVDLAVFVKNGANWFEIASWP